MHIIEMSSDFVHFILKRVLSHCYLFFLHIFSSELDNGGAIAPIAPPPVSAIEILYT